MKEFKLKYGCNPNQTNSKIYMKNKSELPIEILNSTPGYINLMDALNGWQLVKELKATTGFPAATSFKHVSPTGAAIGTDVSKDIKSLCRISDLNLTSKIALACAKARGADRLSSFGDFVALSDICDEQTAKFLKREVSDGIIAPGYSTKALEILKTKKNDKYTIIKIDPEYEPVKIESRDIFGITFQQERNTTLIDHSLIKNVVTKNQQIPDTSKIDLIIAMIVVKYTQSNSVCYVKNNMSIGIGAGQQSRIHCTKLAGNKADLFWLKQHPKVLNLKFSSKIKRTQIDNAIDAYINLDYSEFLKTVNYDKIFLEKPVELTETEKKSWIFSQKDVALASDAFFPFDDNIKRAAKSGVKYISQPGGSIRDDDVIKCCNDFNISMVFTDTRLFLH